MKIMAICMVPLMARSGRRLATKLPTNVITSTLMSSGQAVFDVKIFMLLICPRACGAGQDIACKADADRLIRRDAEERHKHWPG